MTVVRLPHLFTPRDYQADVLKAVFVEKLRHVYWIVHRRAGKSKTAINVLCAAAMQRVGTFLMLFPQTNQCRRVVWTGIDGDGMRFLDHIPQSLIASINNTNMSITLINGSIIQLAGSNNFDALMGTNPVFIIYDEYPLHNPMARQYLNPILLENGGTELIIGTPRGKNHAYKLYQMALQDPTWYVKKLTIDETRKEDGLPIITEEDIEQERRNGVAEELIRQEYYCDFNVGTVGAYYTKEMDQAEYEGRICNYDINCNSFTFTSWDLGVSDPTCITFFQQNGNFIDVIYYLEKTDEGVGYFARRLEEIRQQLKIKYKYHFAPHDIAKREWGSSARSSLALAHDAGIHFLKVPNVGIDNGIQAVKALFPRFRFHATNCAPLIDALKEYKREYDETNRVFKSAPLHNWASHPADSVRYLAVAWRDQFTRPDLSEPRKYQTILTPNAGSPGQPSAGNYYT